MKSVHLDQSVIFVLCKNYQPNLVTTRVTKSSLQTDMPRKASLDNLRRQIFALRHGCLEFAILLAINSIEPSMSIREIEAETIRSHFKSSTNTLYPILNKLRQEKILESTWDESDVGKPRKHYQLTRQGRKTLKILKMNWGTLKKDLDRLAVKRSQTGLF